MTTATAEPTKVNLLICKCRSCTHWEVGENFLHCKTCGTTVQAKILVDISGTKLHWEPHKRHV